MRLHVEWIEDESCFEGGHYAICKGNGHVLAFFAYKGRNELVLKHAQEICRRYNVIEESFEGRYPS